MGVLQEFMANTLDFSFIYYGPMRSSKTSTAVKDLLELQNHSPWKNHIIAFRPRNDSRKTSESASMVGFDSLPNFYWADPSFPQKDVFKALKEHGIYKTKKYNRKHIVAIDEFNFFDDSVNDLITILNSMEIKTVLCGLDLDYRGRPFRSMETILSLVSQRWKQQFSSCCEFGKGGECEFPARYTQRHTLTNGVWRPSSFFEATVIPEGEENQNCKYSVVCKQHHRVRHVPTDAFGNHEKYQKQFRHLDLSFQDGNEYDYEQDRERLIKDAQKRNVIRK